MSEETKLKRIQEDSDEARYFRECYGGNSIYGVHQALRIWTVTHDYPNGSQAKTLAAMTNVVAEHIEELDTLRNMNARLVEALERIADPRNFHFAGDAQVVAREALSAAEATRAVQSPKGRD